MKLLRETVPDTHVWWRIADPAWTDPLSPAFAQRRGGRWNPPASFPTLYLNEDVVTARLNLRAFIEEWSYEPEDLRDDAGPILVGCTLPRRQVVCDAHSPAGLQPAGLPNTSPLESNGRPVPHDRCQSVGTRAREAGLRGVPRPLSALPRWRRERTGVVSRNRSQRGRAGADACVHGMVPGIAPGADKTFAWRVSFSRGLPLRRTEAAEPENRPSLRY